ncbi:TolC family protein [Magnetococcus sp. PR-3]|uniref:TolC family protein n=1 Tax=Magnetococcus sp. PR-3 TaxID=3120355 RepID=UPI002FCE4298
MHPSVQALMHKAQSYTYAAPGAMGLPNPSITVGVNNVPVSTPTRFDRFLPSNKSVAVAQSFPNRQGRLAKRQLGLSQGDLVRQEAKQQQAKLTLELLTTLAQRQRVAQSMLAIKNQLVKISELDHWLKGELEAGKAVYGRVEELDIQRSELREALLSLVGEDQRYKATLHALVGQTPRTSPPKLTPLAWTVTTPLMVQTAQIKKQLAKHKVDIAQARLNPDYGVSAVWQQRVNNASFNGDDWYGLKATIRVPLWSKWNQQPKIAGAKMAVKQATLAMDDAQRTARARYDAALADYHTSLQLLDALQKRQKEIRDLEAAMERRYEAGEVTLDRVIQPAISRIRLGLDRARQQARQITAAAKIHTLFYAQVDP